MNGARNEATPNGWHHNAMADAAASVTGVCVRAYEADASQLLPGVICIAFSHDGRMFATGGGPDNRVILWDTATVTQMAHWSTVPAVTALAFSPSGSILAMASGYGLIEQVTLGHVQAASTRVVGPLDDVNIDSLTWAGDGTQLAAAAWSGDIWVWDAAERTMVSTCTVPVREWIRLEVARDNSFCLAIISDAMIMEWDIARNTVRREIALPQGDIVDVAYAADLNEVAIARYGAPGISLYRGTDVVLLGQLGSEPCTVTALAFDPTHTWLAAAYADGRIAVWHVASRTCVRQWSLEATVLTALVWHPTASMVAAGDTHGHVWLLQFHVSSP